MIILNLVYFNVYKVFYLVYSIDYRKDVARCYEGVGNMNNWFINTFLKSFGKCKDKRISYKQYNVFYNNLRGCSYKIYNIDNGEREEFRLKDIIIILQSSPVVTGYYEYYVTIR